MHGRNGFLFLWLLGMFTNCGGDALVTVEFPAGGLCAVETKRFGEGEPVIEVILFQPRDENFCDASTEPLSYTIYQSRPQTVWLYGETERNYCLAFERTSGYITISHRAGKITRDSNRFTWCVTPKTEEPESATVRSLTPQASFELLLQ